ncbi:MAG TPA: peptidylprolyl isomerase, partial [Rhodospirillales bacterium]|nr:peptidylprolyl isomerase [Rhodospirillales bacterium]
MLEAIRKHSTGIVVKGLLGLLILSFGAWGIGDMLRGNISEEPVAKIGKVEITPESLTEGIKREMNRLSRILGTRIDRDQARALGIVKSTLNTRVNQTLYGLGAEDLGVTVSDAAVRREI